MDIQQYHQFIKVSNRVCASIILETELPVLIRLRVINDSDEEGASAPSTSTGAHICTQKQNKIHPKCKIVEPFSHDAAGPGVVTYSSTLLLRVCVCVRPLLLSGIRGFRGEDKHSKEGNETRPFEGGRGGGERYWVFGNAVVLFWCV